MMSEKTWFSKRYDFLKGTVEVREHSPVVPQSNPLMDLLVKREAKPNG